MSVRIAAHHRAVLVIPSDPERPDRLTDLGVHALIALWVRGDPDRLRATEHSWVARCAIEPSVGSEALHEILEEKKPRLCR